MKCVKLYHPGQLEIVEVPEPAKWAEDEVKIRVRYGAINADDYNIFIGKTGQIYADFGIFHEISGEIVDLGSYSRRAGFHKGDKVAASPFLPCGSCPSCRAGKLNLCYERFGNGRLAEYVIVNHKQLFRIPKDISLEKGCLSWLAVTCTRCIEYLDLQPGKSVLILGGGSAGQILTQMAKKRMPSLLAVSEPVSSKRLLALENGADVVIDSTAENLMSRGLELTNGIGFDVIIDAAGDFLALQNSVDLLSRGSRLMIFASYDIFSRLQLNLADLYWKECSISTIYGAANASYSGVDTQVLTNLSLDPLIGKKFPIEQIGQAFEAYGSRLFTRILVCP